MTSIFREGTQKILNANASRVQDKFIALNGLRFHYRDWENEGAATLILLHALGRHARAWDPFARAMNERYRVLAIDQRGHGETEWASDYSRERMIEDLEAFVCSLRLERFALLGHSMGARVAYAYAAAHPESVARLVIVDIGPEIGVAGAMRVRRTMQLREVFDDLEDAFRFARAENPRSPEVEQRERTFHNLMPRADGKWVWRYDPALRSPSRPAPRHDPSADWAMLSKITCPTLVVRASESDILGRETAERMAREIPDARLVEIPNSGHQVPFDSPGAFLDAVREFLLGK